ncbi:type I-E CRISPR-associated protein Cse1/CasA [Streptomyces sp. NPDC047085]|uniref:type I-E CRISPR-associated protein Cse1/CasA n=1 Tax=Streptomyces sp. NPDC047085 TaxID=3155140 RepID=UPI0033CEC401
MPSPSYRIDLRPCIPVRCRSRTEYVGLRALFANAHHIDDLALPLPPAHSGLLRILAAITARITALDDPAMPIDDWLEHRQRCLERPDGFPAKTVHDYFDAYDFDLFGVRPWLQDPALADQCPQSSGINALVFGRPSGNNLAWFSTHTDTNPQPLPAREALWHLVAYHYYGPAGRCATRNVDSLKSGRGQAGPLRSTVSFHPHGRTLHETLLLHQSPYRGDGQLPGADACPWEEPAAPDPLRPPPEVTWPARLLTGRSMHAALLIPDPSGHYATDAYLTWATQHPRLKATDPYLIYDPDPDAPAEPRTPRRADADRALWRDLDAMLLAGDESQPGRRPEAFTTLNSLPEPARSQLRVRVCGFDQEGRVNNRIWYTALTPPIWPWAQEHDPDKASRIAECRQAAESMAGVLYEAVGRAWHETNRLGSSTAAWRKAARRSPWPRQALAAYWPRAEDAFWQLIDDDRHARGVFAAEAINALLQATASALNHFTQAGPALARALQALRAAGAAPDDTTTPAPGAVHAQP